MDKERLEGLLIDYIDNTLNDADRRIVEDELSANPEARKLYHEFQAVIRAIEQSPAPEPTERLATNFKDFVNKAASNNQAKGNTIHFSPSFYRIAAAIALLIISGFLAFWISKNNERQKELADIRKEMDDTRQELLATRKMMFGLLNNEQSASRRIQGVNVAMELPRADDEIVEVLMHTMLNDPNTNVRLAALDALSGFQDDPGVRRGLITALTKQTDPMVQIRLIQLMVQMKEKEVVNDLQEIIDDSETMKAVKDEAYNGILKLS